MVIVYHQNSKVVEVQYGENYIGFEKLNIIQALFKIADSYSNQFIVWCHVDLKTNLNLSKLQEIFHHNKIMASYDISDRPFLTEAIGYVDGSPFVKIKREVRYPTWQMSSSVGGVHASVLLSFKNKIKESDHFDYFLNSLAKLAMPAGLLCYSEPAFLNNFSDKRKDDKQSLFVLFRFVKQHYKVNWIFLLLLNLFLYEKKIAFLPFVISLFYLRRTIKNDLLDSIEVQSSKKIVEKGTIDVIIPTIGRKNYLYDVLKDLAKQTHLPKKVIVVEQNPNPESTSELDYITDENWPFLIKHIFTHQAGACNARNLALVEVSGEWVFLNDDDNKFDENLIEKTLENCVKYGSEVSSNFYPRINEKRKINHVKQADFFGSGNSFITSNLLDKVSFSMSFEFGYGEDSDFGMQLRNCGVDILYFPGPEITHLSAPTGGFRIKPVLAWQDDVVQPKPSPTIMLFNLLHKTSEQINGYKTMLFFKFYKVQIVKNPIRYYNNFQKQWAQSLNYANKLKSKK